MNLSMNQSMQAKNDGSDTVGDLQKRVNELRFEANKIQGI